MKIIYLTPIMIFVFGLYFLFKLRFFFILRPLKVIKKLLSSLKIRGNFKALSLALAGTLGVGNIVGVAYGLTVGGAGSVFWMLVSSLFASVIKYSESSLAASLDYQGIHGMMGAIAKSFKALGGPLSKMYAFFVLLLSFSMGTSLQGGAIVGASEHSLKANPITVAALFTIILFFVIVGGVKKIEGFTALAIPIASLIYVFLCIVILIKNANELPGVFANICHSALNFKSGVGGVSAFLISKGLKEGFARGLLSNEAGAGTSAMAEGRSKAHPSDVGLFGVCEVFFDTVILCTLTALTILVSFDDVSSFSSGMQVVFSAFTLSLPEGIDTVLFLLIFVFALSTSVCWYYYGITAAEYLFGRKIGKGFLLPFLLFAFFGSLVSERWIIGFVDVVLLFLCVISLFTLLKNSERILDLSEQGGLISPNSLNKSDS